MLSENALDVLAASIESLKSNFSYLQEFNQETPNLNVVIAELTNRLSDNDPYFHPNYLGHMTGYVCEAARIAYFLAMQINPNNHSYDGGRATTNMELECIREMGELFGWSNFQGHLTSGGTIANLEAVWHSRELGATTVITSDCAHFSHKRISNILGMNYISIPSDASGRMDTTALLEVLKKFDQPQRLVVIPTIGTTLCGAVDPLHEIVEFKNSFGFRVHVDAAYGGYFYIVRSRLSKSVCDALSALPMADSIVIDPHKHGLQAFGCGSLLINCENKAPSAAVYDHESPYTYFDASGVSIGKSTLECSRSGAAAAALWATMQCYPLTSDGDFSKLLSDCNMAATKITDFLQSDKKMFEVLVANLDLDIVVFYPVARNAQEITNASNHIYNKVKELGFYMALAQVDLKQYGRTHFGQATCIRLTLMKKEHLATVHSLYDALCIAHQEYFGGDDLSDK